MPEKRTRERAQRAKARGKAPSTQAGEYVREEIDHVRRGKHGARNTKQAIAIGLSKARRDGVDLPAPEPGATSPETRKRAKRDLTKGRTKARAKSPKRARAATKALEREGRAAASPRALRRQATDAAKRRRPRKTRGARSKERAPAA